MSTATAPRFREELSPLMFVDENCLFYIRL